MKPLTLLTDLFVIITTEGYARVLYDSCVIQETLSIDGVVTSPWKGYMIGLGSVLVITSVLSWTIIRKKHLLLSLFSMVNKKYQTLLRISSR